MSVVTNVLLSFDILENEAEVVDEINGWLSSHHQGYFKDLTEACGGSKAMEIPVYGAAFNYLDVKALLAFIRTLKFKEPQNVQLFVCQQEEEKFTLIQPFSGAEEK